MLLLARRSGEDRADACGVARGAPDSRRPDRPTLRSSRLRLLRRAGARPRLDRVPHVREGSASEGRQRPIGARREAKEVTPGTRVRPEAPGPPQALSRRIQARDVACVRCGRAIVPGAAWDLGHDDVDRSTHVGPEHRNCNRAAGGRQGALARNGRRRRPPVQKQTNRDGPELSPDLGPNGELWSRPWFSW